MNKAIFFDKDGVINIDRGVEQNLNSLELFPESGSTIAYLKNIGYEIFVITNQPVVARGMITEDELIKKFDLLEKMLLEQNKDAKIKKIYYCPHHPNANLKEYRANCDCRKPKPGMILTASRAYDIDLSKSYMIGDRMSDIIAGHLAGCKTVHCLTGMHTEKMIESNLQIDKKIEPHYTIEDISGLMDIIK
ncbi:MAG: HAD family hydrolase [bacterium]|nr:HAD family hydrolase [bacterium]